MKPEIISVTSSDNTGENTEYTHTLYLDERLIDTVQENEEALKGIVDSLEGDVKFKLKLVPNREGFGKSKRPLLTFSSSENGSFDDEITKQIEGDVKRILNIF